MKPFPAKKERSPLEGGPQLRLSTVRQLAFLVAVVVISSTFALAQAGQLDSTFGTGGIFTTNFNQYDVTIDSAVAIQSDGKIVLGGTIPNGASQVGALLRLNTNGTLDSSFGTGGIVTSNFGITDGAAVTAVAIQPNGQILAAAVGDFLLEGSVGRFNPDGSVDTTFGNGGFAVSRSLRLRGGHTQSYGLAGRRQNSGDRWQSHRALHCHGPTGYNLRQRRHCPFDLCVCNRDRAAIGWQDPGNHGYRSADNHRRGTIPASPTSGCDFTLQHRRQPGYHFRHLGTSGLRGVSRGHRDSKQWQNRCSRHHP